MKAAAIAMAALAAAGCTDERPATPGPAGECRSEAAQRFVGMAFAARLAEDARRATGARVVRVIRPGDAVTMDFRSDRLNVELDEAGRVRALRCG